MTALRENLNKTKFYVTDLLVFKIKPDAELVALCQQKGAAVYRGTPIGQMQSLWPFDGLKRAVIEEAETFVRHMAAQGNMLQTSVYQMELWGPYRDKPTGVREVNIEAGNPYVPDGKWAFDSKGTWAPDETGVREVTKDLLDREDFRHGICYRIRGEFLKTRGHQEETTGVVIL